MSLQEPDLSAIRVTGMEAVGIEYGEQEETASVLKRAAAVVTTRAE